MVGSEAQGLYSNVLNCMKMYDNTRKYWEKAVLTKLIVNDSILRLRDNKSTVRKYTDKCWILASEAQETI